MIKLLFLLPPLAFLSTGAGVAQFLPSVRRKPFACRLALFYLLGIAVVGGVLYAGSHLGLLALGRRTVMAVVLAPALAGLA